jgi:hypothetical protein
MIEFIKNRLREKYEISHGSDERLQAKASDDIG